MAKSSDDAPEKEPPPLGDPRRHLPRIRQVEWDHYYMEIALTVSKRANCTGALVGAVLVLENRIVSTGFNGTPAGFMNCLEGGCVRCRDRALAKVGRTSEMSDTTFADGPKQLDLCICVHAEANAILSAARVGTHTDGTTLYTTHKPCFMCLKEAHQAGVRRIVYLHEYVPSPSTSLKQQYELLAEHLRSNDARNFEQLARKTDLIDGAAMAPREPTLDHLIETPEAEPAGEPLAALDTTDVRPAGRKADA